MTMISLDTLDASERKSLARKNDTSVKVLEQLANDESFLVRIEVAMNSNTPQGVLICLADRGDPERQAVAGNPNSSSSLLEKLFKNHPEDYMIQAALARNPSTSPSMLEQLSQVSGEFSYLVRVTVARNPHSPPSILIKMQNDSNRWVKQYLKKQQHSRAIQDDGSVKEKMYPISLLYEQLGYEITGFTLGSDYQTLITGSEDWLIRFWDLESEIVTKKIDAFGTVSALAASSDGKNLFSASGGSQVQVWNLETNQCVKTLPHEEILVTDLALLSDNRRLLTGATNETKWSSGKAEDGAARLWDIETSEILLEVSGNEHGEVQVDLTPDEMLIVTKSHIGVLRSWDVQSGECEGVFGKTMVSSFTISPNGQKLIVGTPGTRIEVWDLKEREHEFDLSISNDARSISDLALSPDEKYLVASTVTGPDQLFDLENQILTTTFGENLWPSWYATFIRNSNSIIVGSGDGTSRLWRLVDD